MAELIMSAFADEYCDSFEGQVKAMKDFGIDYIEVRFVDKKNISTLTDEEVETAKAILDQHGVKISSIGSPLGKINLADDFDAHLALTKRVFDIAKKLDTGLVRIFSFYLPEGKSREECRPAVIERLEKMLDLADKYGIDKRISASLLDTFSCFTQGFLPYGAQLLMAAGLAHITPFDIIGYLYYPMALGLIALLGILFNYPRKYC